MKRKRTLLMTIALLAAVPASSILAAGESFTDDAVVITESPAEEAFSDSTAEAVSPTDEITDILSSSDSAEETDIPDASLSDEKAETTDTAFPIEISSACFPDELFQDYILEKIDSDCDGILSADEAESVTEIDIHGMGIGSLEGIACFPELQQLFCSENNLADLDVSQNLALTTLNCADNLLTSLDLSRNTELTALYCTGNALETLDVTLNTKLSILECDETVTVLRADQTLSAPILTAAVNAPTGVKITWEEVPGAEKYRVFRKVPGGSWKRTGDTTEVSYTDTSAVSGTTYIYTVRCVSSDGASYTSSFDSSGLSVYYLSAPILSSVSNTANGVKITWEAVTGA
ncbi:MAG: hypothetical protein LUF78_13595, partial [Clostridiales bacterium]|nr:hypothetical protein [Clostridiales bacterium]